MFWHKLYKGYNWSKLVFTRQGYDPLIDYLKGICIIFVIINHCMPEIIIEKTGFYFWGVSAVPIFLIIQVFHAYKRGVEYARTNYTKIWRKIILPFIMAELVILVALIIRNHHFTFNYIFNDALSLIKSGGYGPGAYYPFIYLQFAFILPLITWAFKSHKSYLCFVFVIISQLSETACSYFQMPQLAYRLLFIRYIFLFYLGFLLAYKGFILNLYTCCLASVCLAFSIYMVYSHHDHTPFLYVFVNPVCHWFCYIYITFFLLFLMKEVFCHFESFKILRQYIMKAGIYSYEIFLFQIVYFAIADEYMDNIMQEHLPNYYIYNITKIILPIILCTIPVIIYKKEKLAWKQNS